MNQKSRLRFRNLGAALTLTGSLAGTAGFVGAITAPIAAHAQAQFMVVRPENGATVRETVHIQMSRKALEELGVKYLSVSLDGKFKEAVAVLKLPADGKPFTSDQFAVSQQMVALLWDTKLPPSGSNGSVNPLGVEDGEHTLEIIAQSESGRRLGVQTLKLTVLNRGGLQMPADGLEMAYRFQPGDTSKYREMTVVEYVGEHTNAPPPGAGFGGGGGHYLSPGFGQGGFSGSGSFGGQGGPGGGPGGAMGFSSGASAGGRGGPGGGPGGGTLGSGGFGGGRQGGGFGAPGGGYAPGEASGPFTVLVQNVKADFERSTEDTEGGDLFFVRDKVTGGTFISGSSAALLQDVYSLKSRYRTIRSSGAVQDPGLANAEHPGAYIAMPIPNLGGGRRRIGQEWKTLTPIKLEWATLDKPPVVEANNKFEGLEWQDGYQTARILQTFDGKADIPIFGGAGTIKGADVHMSQTIWFAYRAGKIIRMETDMTVNGATPASLLSSMVPGAGVNAGVGGSGGFGGGPGMGSSFPGGPGGGGGLGGPAGDNPGGGFGQLVSTQPQEEARVPAKFHSTSTVQLQLPGMK